MNVTLVEPNGNGFGAPYSPNVNYTIFPLDFGQTPVRLRHQHPGLSTGVPRLTGIPIWTSVVPDGVSSVRWTFACPARSGPCHGFHGPLVVHVPVRNNIAVAIVARTNACGRICFTPRVAWYSGKDALIATYKPSEPSSKPVPFRDIGP